MRQKTYSIKKYEGYDGNSLLSFELLQEGSKTRLKLTQEGLEILPKKIRDHARNNFAGG